MVDMTPQADTQAEVIPKMTALFEKQLLLVSNQERMGCV